MLPTYAAVEEFIQEHAGENWVILPQMGAALGIAMSHPESVLPEMGFRDPQGIFVFIWDETQIEVEADFAGEYFHIFNDEYGTATFNCIDPQMTYDEAVKKGRDHGKKIFQELMD